MVDALGSDILLGPKHARVRVVSYRKPVRERATLWCISTLESSLSLDDSRVNELRRRGRGQFLAGWSHRRASSHIGEVSVALDKLLPRSVGKVREDGPHRLRQDSHLHEREATR